MCLPRVLPRCKQHCTLGQFSLMIRAGSVEAIKKIMRKNVINLVWLSRVLFSCALLLGPTLANATTVTYILDQSNVLADDVDYLSVMISDNTQGQLDFRVSTLSALSDQAGNNYGIQSFGLNSPGDLSMFILPDGWSAQYNKTMNEAGMFDVRLAGTGSSRQDPLMFSVIGLTLEDVTPEFAAHVAGFEYAMGVSSAFFYGGRPAEVPLPATAIIFLSGIFGLAGFARRRTASVN